MKKVINYILSVILSISVIAFFSINLASSTILSEQYILKKLQNEDYYNKINELVKSNFENYIHQSGLDEEVLDNIITKEKVKKDTRIIIGNLYEGLNEEIDTTEIKENLNKKIKEFLNKNNIETAPKEQIDEFIEHICNEYKTTMAHFSVESKIGQQYLKIKKYIDLSKKVLLITIGIDFILLIVLNLKRVYKFFTSIGLSLTISGSILLIINLFINTKIKIQTITILNDIVSMILRNILSEILNIINKYGIIMLVLGIFLITIPNLIHNYKKYGKLKKIGKTYEEN